MKTISILLMSLIASQSFASNYPSDYCNARVTICKDGPGLVAKVFSGCRSAYVFGYKKNGRLGNNSFVDAVVMIPQFNLKKDLRISPDWSNLGFLTSGVENYTIFGSGNYDSFDAFTVAYSDGHGGWDSKNGANYQFPVGKIDAPGCVRIVTNDDYQGTIPFSVWSLINDALRN